VWDKTLPNQPTNQKRRRPRRVMVIGRGEQIIGF
jgi:hypothetical protein